MSRPAGWLEGAQSVTQTVQVADAGYGYAVIGGDMEVFQGRWPAYVLGEYQTEPKADVSSLLAQPSRMLDARSAVVDFTGREAELAELERWRDAPGSAVAARWLYAPGGQGKTRLALEFASRCALAGFKVVTVTQGSVVKPSPGVQDLRLRGARGLLVLVDYADRWPVSHLSWLFSNALFGHADVPTRLLLLARSAQPWPAIRAVLGDLRSDTSEQRLSSLPGGAGLDDRERMFATARDCFAACHGITQTAGISSPGPLSGPEFGLTLTLHMAALTAVDAHVNGLRPPQGAAGLSAYLLDRERSHWTRLYENRVEGLQYRTPPDVMARAVFTAVLTGAAPHQRGSEILGLLGLEMHPDRVLADHAACYPPSDPGTVLEPLYPDRLAEDFLALALPGHSVAGYEPWPWAPVTAEALAAPRGDGSPPPYTARMITFLAAAASSGRWPHVVGTLAKILEANPAAAVMAGGPVLAALAEVTDLDPETLARVEPYLPDRPHADLDLGIATLVQRLAGRRLTTATDPAERAAIHTALATRYANAGLHGQAATAGEAAVGIARELAEAEPETHQPGLASALDVLGRARTDSGDFLHGLALLEEAVAIRRRLAEADPAAHLPGLAASLHNLSRMLLYRGREDAVAPAEEALAIRRELATQNPAAYLPDLATSLSNAAIRWREARRAGEALAANEEALDVRRKLADIDRAAYLPDLATTLNNLGSLLYDMGRPGDAIAYTEEAVAIRRQLADQNPAAYLRGLAVSLHNLGLQLQAAGRDEAVLQHLEEALGIQRELADANPAAYLLDLAMSLRDLGQSLLERGRAAEALPLIGEAVAASRKIVTASPNVGSPLLGMFLNSLGVVLSRLDRVAEARAAYEESVAIRRALARDDPGQLSGLGSSLANLRNLYRSEGQAGEALAASGELVATCRALALLDLDNFRPQIAPELVNHGLLLRMLGRSAEASTYTREGVEHFRGLAEEDPRAYRPHLAQGLVNLCVAELALGHGDPAAALAEEAVGLYRILAEADPAAHSPGLAGALFGLAGATFAAGNRAELRAALDEALAIYARLARQDPRQYKAKLKEARSRARLLRHGRLMGIAVLALGTIFAVIWVPAYAVARLAFTLGWRLPVAAVAAIRQAGTRQKNDE